MRKSIRWKYINIIFYFSNCFFFIPTIVIASVCVSISLSFSVALSISLTFPLCRTLSLSLSLSLCKFNFNFLFLFQHQLQHMITWSAFYSNWLHLQISNTTFFIHKRARIIMFPLCFRSILCRYFIIISSFLLTVFLWLSDWLTDWLTGWLAGWLTDWLTLWLSIYLSVCLSVCLSVWSCLFVSFSLLSAFFLFLVCVCSCV